MITKKDNCTNQLINSRLIKLSNDINQKINDLKTNIIELSADLFILKHFQNNIKDLIINQEQIEKLFFVQLFNVNKQEVIDIIQQYRNCSITNFPYNLTEPTYCSNFTYNNNYDYITIELIKTFDNHEYINNFKSLNQKQINHINNIINCIVQYSLYNIFSTKKVQNQFVKLIQKYWLFSGSANIRNTIALKIWIKKNNLNFSKYKKLNQIIFRKILYQHKSLKKLNLWREVQNSIRFFDLQENDSYFKSLFKKIDVKIKSLQILSKIIT